MKGRAHGSIWGTSWYWPGGTEEDNKNLRIAGTQAEIWPWNLQNTKREYYRLDRNDRSRRFKCWNYCFLQVIGCYYSDRYLYWFVTMNAHYIISMMVNCLNITMFRELALLPSSGEWIATFLCVNSFRTDTGKPRCSHNFMSSEMPYNIYLPWINWQ